MKIRLKTPDIVILFTIGSTLLYIVSKNIPGGLGSFRFLWGPLCLITIFLFKRQAFFKGPLLYVIFYGLISVGILQFTLWTYMDDWNRLGILEDFYSLAVSVAIWSYFRNGDIQRLKLISKWAFVFIIITLIMTNIALTIDPLIVRNSATGFTENPYQLRLNKLTGAAQYGYAQALVLLIPILVYYIKNRKPMVFPRRTLIIILVLLLITTIRANIFANLLVAALITIMSFLGSKKRILVYRYMAIFVIVFIIVPSSFFADIFSTLGSYFKPGTTLNYKLYDFAIFMQKPEIDVTTGAGGRAERYPMLFEAFIANPFFGYASHESIVDISAGGHLYWMNKLAQWGIFGFLFYISVLKKIYSNITSVFVDSEIRFYYFLSAVAFVCLGLLKNMAGREPWFFMIVVIPGLFLYSSSSGETINRKQTRENND